MRLKWLSAGFLVSAIALVSLVPARAAALDDSFGRNGEKAAEVAFELIDSLGAHGLSLSDLGVADDVEISELSIGEAVVGYECAEEGLVQSGTLYWPLFFEDSVVLVLREVLDECDESGYVLTVENADDINYGFAQDCRVAALVNDSGLLEICFGPEGTGLGDVNVSGTCDGEFPMVLLDKSASIEYASRDFRVPLLGGDTSFSRKGAVSVQRAASISSLSFLKGLEREDIVPQGGEGLCWAATSATVINYLTNSIATAHSVCDRIEHGYSGGGENDIVEALSAFKYANSYTGINAVRKVGQISTWETQTWITSGIPIIAVMTASSGGSNHSLTICGWTKYSDESISFNVANSGTGSFEVIRSVGGNVFGHYYGGNQYVWTRSSIVMPGWQKPFGGYSWSYLNDNGVREKGWFKYDGWYYHFDDDGFMETSSWISYNGEWYYVDKDGQMEVNNWVRLVDKWYYFDDEGVAARSEWKYLDSNWYAFNSDCQMRTGWYNESGNWYYLRTATNTPGGGPEGSMLRSGTWTINGTSYRFDSNGVCLNP